MVRKTGHSVMTKLLFINKGILVALLFLFGCNVTTEGCLWPDACNYNPDANRNDDSCWYTTEGCTCDDEQDSVVDDCDVCDTDTSNDCTQDECGVWDFDPSNDCTQDECGVWGGDGVDEDEDGMIMEEIILPSDINFSDYENIFKFSSNILVN